MKKHILNLLQVISLAAIASGCTTATIYQSPITDFQKAVNSANNSIRPYLVGVNSLNAKANLYDKISLGRPWGTEDLTNVIPSQEIQLRLQALSAIASYANALAAVANPDNLNNLAEAAKSLGDDVNGLNTTIQALATKRAAGTSNAKAKQAAALDLSAPVSSLVTLVGTLVIEHKEKAAIEKAIIDGEKPINALIDLLKNDLQSLTALDDAAYAAIQTGTVLIYQDARGKTDPKGLIALVDQLQQSNDNIQTLRAVQIGSLLSDMKSAHAALVSFAKSSKSPKDIAALAAQINVFTAHVKLFDDAISSIQTVVNSK